MKSLSFCWICFKGKKNTNYINKSELQPNLGYVLINHLCSGSLSWLRLNLLTVRATKYNKQIQAWSPWCQPAKHLQFKFRLSVEVFVQQAAAQEPGFLLGFFPGTKAGWGADGVGISMAYTKGCKKHPTQNFVVTYKHPTLFAAQKMWFSWRLGGRYWDTPKNFAHQSSWEFKQTHIGLVTCLFFLGDLVCNYCNY